MSTRRLALVFAALLAVFLLATLPLRLVLAGSGITARSVSGSLWNGQLTAAAWHGLALGDIDVALAPLPLLTGQRRVNLATATLTGQLGITGDGVTLTGLTGIIAPGPVAGIPVTLLRLGDFGTSFDIGRCQAATGSLAVEIGGPLADRGAFAGTPRCDGDRLLLPLQGQGGRIDLQLAGDGSYSIAVALDNVDTAARPALLANGFQPTPTGLALTLQGRLQ